MGGTRTCIK